MQLTTIDDFAAIVVAEMGGAGGEPKAFGNSFRGIVGICSRILRFGGINAAGKGSHSCDGACERPWKCTRLRRIEE